jgi:hypothetical protein
MLKKFLIIMMILLSLTNIETVVNAQVQIPENPLGDNVIPIEEAVDEFESLYLVKVKTPKYLPLKPTITGGHIEQAKYLRLDYLDEKSYNSFSTHIRIGSFTSEGEKSAPKVQLKNNIEASFISNQNDSFDFLIFRENNITYNLGINRNFPANTKQVLTKVANSMLN